MAGMSQTCNHVAALLFRVETAVKVGFKSPSCTANSHKRLPSRKKELRMKVKDIDFSRDDFGKRGKKGRTLVSLRKKRYDPHVDCEVKLFNLNDLAEAVADIETADITLRSGIPKAKEEYSRKS